MLFCANRRENSKVIHPFDPYWVLAEIERQTGGATPERGGIFVCQMVLDFMVKLPVIEERRAMWPAPHTTYLGLPVYLDPTLPPFGGFRVILDITAASNQLFMITHATAMAEMVTATRN